MFWEITQMCLRNNAIFCEITQIGLRSNARFCELTEKRLFFSCVISMLPYDIKLVKKGLNF
jgi:hypothetical protein